MREARLPWGSGGLPLPPGLAEMPRLEAPGLPAAPDPRAAARAAAQEVLEHLERLPDSRPRLAVIVPDGTRPLPLALLLAPLLDLLGAAAGASVPVLVPASGIHRPMSFREMIELVGPAQAQRVRLAPHDADEPGCLLGTTPDLVPAVVHPAIARADAIVAVGRIVFHYLAGFGGGRKLLFPGVATRRSALAIHRRCMVLDPLPARHARARSGILEGNPVHLAACAAAGLAPPTIALHVLTAPDGTVSSIRVGDPVRSHRAACETWASAHRVVVEQPLDAVLVSAGGHPTDRNLVQAHKALDAIAPVVRPGGLVVLAARCEDGVGNPEVRGALQLGSAERIGRVLARRFTIGGHTAWTLREKCERLDVRMLTELDDETLELAGMRRVAGLDQVSGLFRRVQAAGGRCALAPFGASLLYVPA